MHRLVLTLLWLASGPFSLAGAAPAGGSVRVEIKDPKGAPVADAVASLTPLDRTPALAPPTAPVVIEQIEQEFQPYVTPVVVGTRVSFPNRDKVMHHVFSLSAAKKFDIPRYKGEVPDTILFDKPGIVALGCNIHDWMSAYVVVVSTPHFSRSGADGLVPLADVPAGRYRLEVWHPRIDALVSREVAIGASDSATQVISVTLKTSRRIRRAPEAGAAGYK